MTKDTDEFLQFTEPVTCREYTLPRDEKSTDPKGWIRGNTKIGPVLEVTTSYLQGKHGVEIRIESVNKDNSHSWVRTSRGLNKLVTDDEQESSETKTELFALKTEVFARERICIDIEPGAQSDQAYPVAKRLNTLLRHGDLPREEDGAIEFWRLKDDFWNKIGAHSTLV